MAKSAGRAAGGCSTESGEAGGDVLLSEVALGQWAMGSSGTVIAMDAPGAGCGRERHPVGRQRDYHGRDCIAPADNGLTRPMNRPRRWRRNGGRRGRLHGQPVEELNLTLDEDLKMTAAARWRSLAAAGLDAGRVVGHRPQRQGTGRRRSGARRQRHRQRRNHRRR